jgi:hypothetical protein
MDKLFAINIDNEYWVYARYFIDFLFVYEHKTDSVDHVDVENILKSNVLFAVFVDKRDLKKWRKICDISTKLSEQYLLKKPSQFLQDTEGDIEKCEILNEFGEFRKATIEECRGLESISVWYPYHVECRIRCYYKNKPCPVVEHLKLRER